MPRELPHPPEPESVKGMYQPGELATILRVDPKTVSRWCAAGKVPGAFQTPGGHWRVPGYVAALLMEGVPVTEIRKLIAQ
jgi:predicted site-specific integrase-resolvase